jgi:hypothetical protein
MVLLDGNDLGIHEKDPDKVREMLSDPKAVADQLERMQIIRKIRVNSLKG